MKCHDKKPYKLTDEELSDLVDALGELRRGEFAGDEEVAAVFAKFNSAQGKPHRPSKRARHWSLT